MKNFLIALLAISLMLTVLGCTATTEDDINYDNAIDIKDTNMDAAIEYCQNIKYDELHVECMENIWEGK